jgi:hypothetical protein
MEWFFIVLNQKITCKKTLFIIQYNKN